VTKPLENETGWLLSHTSCNRSERRFGAKRQATFVDSSFTEKRGLGPANKTSPRYYDERPRAMSRGRVDSGTCRYQVAAGFVFFVLRGLLLTALVEAPGGGPPRK
jgi:hypothetical protein